MNHFLFIVFFISLIFPSFSAIPGIPGMTIIFYICLLWFLLIKPLKFLRDIDYLIIIIIIMHLMYNTLGWYDEDVYARHLTMILLPYISVKLLWSYYELQPLQYKGQVVKLFIVGMAITAITTFIGLNFFPTASRNLAGQLASVGDLDTARFYLLLGIGGYSFSFAFSLIILIMLYWIFNPKYLFFSKPLAVFIALLMVVTMFKMGYTGQILILFLGVFVTRFRYWDYLGPIGKVFTISLFVLLYQVSFLFAPFFYFLSDLNLGYSEISSRLENIAMRLDGTLLGTDIELTDSSDFRSLDKRDLAVGAYEILARKSWNGFLNNPIIGGSDIGGHHFFLDWLGTFGLIGFIPLFLVFVRLYKLAQSKIQDPANRLLFSKLFFLMLVLGLIKNILLFVTFLYVFFFIPLILHYSELKKSQISDIN